MRTMKPERDAAMLHFDWMRLTSFLSFCVSVCVCIAKRQNENEMTALCVYILFAFR